MSLGIPLLTVIIVVSLVCGVLKDLKCVFAAISNTPDGFTVLRETKAR